MSHVSSDTPISHVTFIGLARQRRRGARRPLNADVRVVEPQEGSGVAINASDGGLRIAVDCALHPDDHVVMILSDDGQDTVERARVVWSRELKDGWIVGLERVGLN